MERDLRLRCRMCEFRCISWEEFDSHMLVVHHYDGVRFLDEEETWASGK